MHKKLKIFCAECIKKFFSILHKILGFFVLNFVQNYDLIFSPGYDIMDFRVAPVWHRQARPGHKKRAFRLLGCMDEVHDRSVPADLVRLLPSREAIEPDLGSVSEVVPAASVVCSCHFYFLLFCFVLSSCSLHLRL